MLFTPDFIHTLEIIAGVAALLAFYEAAKWFARVYAERNALREENRLLKARQDERLEDILDMYSRRMDTSYHLDKLALTAMLEATWARSHTMTTEVIERFVKTQREEKALKVNKK